MNGQCKLIFHIFCNLYYYFICNYRTVRTAIWEVFSKFATYFTSLYTSEIIAKYEKLGKYFLILREAACNSYFIDRWLLKSIIARIILGGLYLKSDMKIDRYETEKSHRLQVGLSKCSHVQKWYEIHIGVDFISVILTDLKFNTWYELLYAYL